MVSTLVTIDGMKNFSIKKPSRFKGENYRLAKKNIRKIPVVKKVFFLWEFECWLKTFFKYTRKGTVR